jgi:hypothetical protein
MDINLVKADDLVPDRIDDEIMQEQAQTKSLHASVLDSIVLPQTQVAPNVAIAEVQIDDKITEERVRTEFINFSVLDSIILPQNHVNPDVVRTEDIVPTRVDDELTQDVMQLDTIDVPEDSISLPLNQLATDVFQAEDIVPVRIDDGPTQELMQLDTINTSEDSEQADAREARALLKFHGIDVEPQFRLTICIDCQDVIPFDHAFGHRRTRHCDDRKDYARLGTKESLDKALRVLKAHTSLPLPFDRIPAIRTLSILTAYRCDVPNCCERKIYSSTKLVSEHYARSHRDIPTNQRRSTPVLAQRLGRFRGTTRLVEVIPPLHVGPDDALSDILRHFHDSVSGSPTSFQLTKNVRAKSEFLSKTRWDTVLKDVDLKRLREAVRAPSEPFLTRLQGLARQYYHTVAAGLDSTLSTLVLRYIHSADPE